MSATLHPAPAPPRRRAAAPDPEPPAPASEWRRTLGGTVWAAGLVATGTLSIAGVFGTWRALLALLAAAILPMVLQRAVIALGVARWAAALVITVLLVLVGYLMTAGAGTSLLDTLSDAVPRLLTEPAPYATRADLLAAPVLLTGLVSLLAGLRVEPRTRVGPVAGGLLLYVCGALLASGESDPHGLIAVLLVALALAGWVLLDRRPEPTRQRAATALPVLATVCVLLAGIALVPVGGAFSPRDHLDPPVVDVEAASPLPRLGAWAANPDSELLRVRGDAVPLRLVTLRDHDGSQWRAATSYAPIGSSGRRSLPDGDLRRTVSSTVELSAVGGPWLPTPGDPTRVSAPGAQAVVDLETGTVYDPEAEVGTRYEITGVVDAPDPQDLVTATVPTGPAAAPYLEQPGLPSPLAEYADQVIAGTTTPYEQALAIEQAVENQRELSPQATSGSAYWRIEQFLLGTPGTPGARVGTSEQFATAFALLARRVGLPTRLVVGFRPGEPEEAGSETRIVRGSDALAWPEVYFDGLGWVPFSPTPNDDTFDDGRPIVGPDPVEESGSEPQTEPTGPGAGTEDSSTPGGTGAGAAADPAATSSRSWTGLAAGGLLLLVAGVLLLLRRLRTARHLRRGDAGAWAEVLDALVLSGQPADPARTATQVADDTDHRLGTQAARRLADRAERAVFGPGSAAAAGPRPTELKEVRRAARSGVPLWRRWWWWFDPRVLGR